MNLPILIAGIVAAIATIGHFTVGVKIYLSPMLRAQFNPTSKYVISGVFHYVSIFQTLSSISLIMIGIWGDNCKIETDLILGFLGINYCLFAIVQFISISKSRVKGAWLPMFQWIFWITISLFIFVGLELHLLLE